MCIFYHIETAYQCFLIALFLSQTQQGMFPEDLNCAGRYCFVMTTKHPFSPTWSCLISHYCFFLPILLLKYIAKFNIQYKKIFISLFPFLYALCAAHTSPFPSSTNTTKKDSPINVKIIVSCGMGFSSGSKSDLPGNVTQSHLSDSAHLGLHSQHRATDHCSRKHRVCDSWPPHC